MAIFKRGRTYWYNFWWDNEHVQRSSRQGNPRVARQMESAHRTRLAKGEVGIEEPKQVPRFRQFAAKFLQEMRSLHETKPKTITYYEYGLSRLLEFEPLPETRLDRVDEVLIAAYISRRKAHKKRSGKSLQVATINRELEVLRRMLRLAHEWKIIPTVPKIRRLPGERMRDRILTHVEEEAYLSNAPHLLRDIATIILETGMRPEEVFRMRSENVHFEPAGNARYGYVHNPFGKTKYARRNIPMTERVRAVLEMRHAEQSEPAEGWVFPAETKSGRVESVKSQHASAFKWSGIKNWFVLYSLRHTLLTRLGEAGADAFTIQKVAGHSSITISQRYVHPTPERVEQAFAQLEAYNLQKGQPTATANVQ